MLMDKGLEQYKSVVADVTNNFARFADWQRLEIKRFLCLMCWDVSEFEPQRPKIAFPHHSYGTCGI